MIEIVPCKKCKDRAPRCHGKCEKYAEYKRVHEFNKQLREDSQAPYPDNNWKISKFTKEV